MIHLLIALAALGLAAFIVYDFVTVFRSATGTTWQRILAAGKHTETILWARFVQLVGALSAFLAGSADWFNLPAVGDFIRTVLSDPVYVAGAFVGIAIVTEWARRYKATDLS